MLVIGSCFIREKFGIYCPGCGGRRALDALCNYDLSKSFLYNPIVLLLIVWVIFTSCNLIVLLIDGYNPKIGNNQKFINRLLIITMIAVFLIRNILLLLNIDTLGSFN